MMRQTLMAACVAVISGPAMGQGEQLVPGREPPIGGPPVVDRMPPGLQSSFSGEEGGRGRMEQARVPHDLFMQAVFSLDAPETPGYLRLTEDQRLRIRELEDAFRRDMRAHMAKHAGEFRGQLRRDGALDRPARPDARPDAPPAARRPGNTPGGPHEARPQQRRLSEPGAPPEVQREGRPDVRPAPQARPAPAERPAPQRVEPGAVQPPVDPAERRALAQRIAEIRRAGPQIADVEVKVWNLLTEEQRAHVGARLEAARREIDARRDETYREMMTARLRAEREKRGRADDPPGAGDPARRRAVLEALERGEIPAELLERLPDRARERLLSMSPEDRRRAIERLMERRLGEGRARQDRPPPPMDTVDVPEPR